MNPVSDNPSSTVHCKCKEYCIAGNFRESSEKSSE